MHEQLVRETRHASFRLREMHHDDTLLTRRGVVHGGGKRSGPTPMEFQQQENAGFSNAPFNVLYVQTPRPAFLDTPLAGVLMNTLKETVDLVKPAMRFGLPETSLKTKCPYWRDDNRPVPTTPSLPLQHLLSSRNTLNAKFIHESAGQHHFQSGSAHEHQPHVKPSRFMFHTPLDASFVVALNIGAYIWLSTTNGKPR